ncbi:methyltransferase domain-containing protein [Kribbella antibiotica]|uniref:Methyltransferase domain-containing protein n=1 Tax=Kribbella antibiotica TaxID=190195 RepID=A0A4R4ZQ32_9ACTN|nr:methyltransferase domain-containing protein [Kribbella antibiotica]TDD61058.1 methyltransferase domain-containing protein [Kribbella antibiotica]
MSLLGTARAGVNRVLRPTGMQLVRGYSSDPGISPFLPARKTLAAAKRAGVSVGDYLDDFSAEPGSTGETVAAMLRLGELSGDIGRVCEIGPGSGRYLTRVMDALHPNAYEVYETAPDWLNYLRQIRPELVVRDADGHSLGSTDSASVDLVHSHKLFCYIPFIVAFEYIVEMARVVRPGGVVAFDVITDACLDDAVTKTWLAEPSRATIYSLTPRDWLLDFAGNRGLELRGSHFVPLSGGRTELLVFRRREQS